MRRVWLIWLLLLAGCGTAEPATDFPQTIVVLETTVAVQATTIGNAQSDNLVLGERVAELQTTATALAIRPTSAPPTAVPTVELVVGGGISPTAALSSTTPLSATHVISDTQQSSGDCGPLPDGVIDYEAAAQHIGEVATVQGRVVQIGGTAKVAFLNFHDPYQGYFVGVIFANAWSQFNGTFESLYVGRCVRITGMLKEYNGAPEIIIETPAQVEVLP